MRDDDLVRFLQWALPRLGYRWPGFRKVRGQVKKRIADRLDALGLDDLDAYRAFLEEHPGAWERLDALCSITISRFWRDHRVWERLADTVLPALARDDTPLRCWSAGCASGEEPYGLALIALHRLEHPVRIVATDREPVVLERAERACYPEGNAGNLPDDLLEAAFERTGDEDDPCCLVDERVKDAVTLREHDLRDPPPEGPFDLVCCRNLAFTYFDEAGQRATADRLAEVLVAGGALVVGAHEEPPDGAPFTPWEGAEHVHRRA